MCAKVLKGILLSLCSLVLVSCSGAPKERKIDFIYMALGASDATGVGAIPLTEGYVYLINRGLQQRMPGTNDLVHGDDPRKFQEDLRFLLRTVHDSVSKTIVIANIPDLTQLPRFRATPSPAITPERIKAYNRAIESEAAAVDARLLNLFIQPVREDLVFDLDGFHPNEAGHRELARLFLDVIFPLVKAR
jgi:hypothetical protein